MARWDLGERERREVANAHRGEVVGDSAEPVEPRRLGQIVSLRLESDAISALRDVANRRGITVSDLLREGVAMVIAADEQVRQITDLTYEVVRIDSAVPMRGAAEHTTSNPVRLERPLSATA